MKVIAPKEFTNVTYGKEDAYSIISANLEYIDTRGAGVFINIITHVKDGPKQIHFAIIKPAPESPNECKFYIIDEPENVDYFELEILR